MKNAKIFFVALTVILTVAVLGLEFSFLTMKYQPESLQENADVFDEYVVEDYPSGFEVQLLSNSYNNYKTYTEADMNYRWQVSNKSLSDGSYCTSMQGMYVGTNYIYTAKIVNDQPRCAFVRTNISTGEQIVMNYYSSVSASYPTPCDTAGHANDITMKNTTENGATVTYMYVATMESGNAITRMKVDGSNLYFTGSFDLVNSSGTSIGVSAIKWARTAGGYNYFLLKSGNTFYYCKISATASGGSRSAPQKVNCYRIFTIDTRNAVFAKSNSKSETMQGLDSWVNQGFGYDSSNKVLYVPIWNENYPIQNAIITYNLSDVLTSAAWSATSDSTVRLYPTKTNFLFALSGPEDFEIESCGFRTGQGTTGDLQLYFNANSDNSWEGIYSFNFSRNSGPFENMVTDESIIYSVKYNGNGNTGGSMSTTRHINGISATLRQNAFYKDGYSFGGWYLYRKSDKKWLYEKSNGKVGWYTEGEQPTGAYKALYSNEQRVSKLSAVNGDVVTLYAQWNATTGDNLLEGYSPIDLGSGFYAHVRQASTGLYVTDKDYCLFLSKGVFDETQIWCFERQGDGSYVISTNGSGCSWDINGCMYIDGRKVGTYATNGTDAQRFFIYFIEGNFYFRAATAYKTLDVDASTGNLQLYGCGTGISTKAERPLEYEARSFEIVKYSLDGYSMINRGYGTDYVASIVNASTGKYLTAKSNSVVFKDANGKNTQKWYITQNPDGSQVIRSVSNGLALDVEGRGMDAGTTVGLYEYNGSIAQNFYFHADGDVSVIKPVYSNCVFDMDAVDFIPHLYPYGTSDVQKAAQRFLITDVSPLSSLKITSKPSKTEYIVGETFDYAGLEVSAVTEDGTEFSVFDFTVSLSGKLNTEGVQTVTVSYGGKKTTFKITVSPQESPVLVLVSTSGYSKENTVLKGVEERKTASEIVKSFDNTGVVVVNTEGVEVTSNDIVGTGFEVRLIKNGEVLDSLVILVSGDVDGSGVVDSTDYLRLKQYFIGGFALNDIQFVAGDVDESGKIDTTDYLGIKSRFLSQSI